MERSLNNWGSISDRGKRFFASPKRPDRLWNPCKFLFSGHQQVLVVELETAEVKSEWSCTFTPHMPSLRVQGHLYLPRTAEIIYSNINYGFFIYMHCFTDSCLSRLNTLDDVNMSVFCTRGC
jgi:hypothetical protein